MPLRSPCRTQALSDVLRRVMLPLARLALARGLPQALAEQTLQQAFAQASRDPQTVPG